MALPISPFSTHQILDADALSSLVCEAAITWGAVVIVWRRWWISPVSNEFLALVVDFLTSNNDHGDATDDERIS